MQALQNSGESVTREQPKNVSHLFDSTSACARLKITPALQVTDSEANDWETRQLTHICLQTNSVFDDRVQSRGDPPRRGTEQQEQLDQSSALMSSLMSMNGIRQMKEEGRVAPMVACSVLPINHPSSFYHFAISRVMGAGGAEAYILDKSVHCRAKVERRAIHHAHIHAFSPFP